MPAVIYRTTDLIALRLPGGFTVWVSPLSQEARGKLRALYHTEGGESKNDALLIARETLRMTVKKVEGVFYADGSPFKAEPGTDGLLTEQCAAELLDVAYSDQFAVAACQVGLAQYQNLTGEASKHFKDVTVEFPGAEKKTTATP